MCACVKPARALDPGPSLNNGLSGAGFARICVCICGKKKVNIMGHRHVNLDRFRGRSIRLPNRDYRSPGAYFVTICAYGRQTIFETPALRELLQEHWLALPERFPTVRLDEFVIMPDHLHFILWLEGQQSTNPRLSEVIGAYKSLVAVAWIKHVENNELNCSARVWQKGYYERVVRQDELDQTRYYIRTNPLKLMPSSYLESEQ